MANALDSPVPAVMGRPSLYSEELATTLCLRIESGRSTISICRDDSDMPDASTFYRWRNDRPDFRDKVAQAREARLEAWADRMAELGSFVLVSDIGHNRVNAAINALDKAARLQMPKVAKVEVTSPDGSLASPDGITAREMAKALVAILGASGLLPAPAGDVIDITPNPQST